MENYWPIMVAPLLAGFLIFAEAVRSHFVHPEL